MGKMQGLFAEAMPHGQGGDSSAQCLAADELMKKVRGVGCPLGSVKMLPLSSDVSC
jgi:hypothetical protein